MSVGGRIFVFFGMVTVLGASNCRETEKANNPPSYTEFSIAPQ